MQFKLKTAKSTNSPANVVVVELEFSFTTDGAANEKLEISHFPATVDRSSYVHVESNIDGSLEELIITLDSIKREFAYLDGDSLEPLTQITNFVKWFKYDSETNDSEFWAEADFEFKGNFVGYTIFYYDDFGARREVGII